MNARGILLLLLLISLSFTGLYAQRASAEFISSLAPMKLESGEQVKDGVQNIFYKDYKLYVTNVWAGLQIVDISDVSNPIELGSFRADRTHNVYVDDKYAYLSNELSGVTVLDVNDPANPMLVSKIRTKGDAFNVVANYPLVYVAEEMTGINIYDISDLANPKQVGGFDTPGWAWGLSLQDNNLFVADKSGGLLVLDVTNPTAPSKIGQLSSERNVKTVQVENKVAYLACGPDGLVIVDVSNPTFPQVISKFAVDGFVYNAFKSGTSVFLANEVSKKIEIINITDIKNPVKEGEYIAEGKVYAAVKYDVYVYVAADISTEVLRHNHPPVLVNIDNQTVNEVDLLSIIPDGHDPDGDEIYYTIKNLPEGATFDSLSGAFGWTPTFEQSGLYPKIMITAIERTASALSASTTFDIQVIHVNRNPSIADIPDTLVNENVTMAFTIPAGTDQDIEDKGKLTYTAENLPEGAVFDPIKRTFTWTPTFEQSGTYVVDFAVHDPAGGLMRDPSTITVNHVDRKPVLEVIAAQSVNENMELTFKLNGVDPDAEDQNALSYKAEKLPEGAVFNPQTATFSWTPTYDQSGLYEKALFIFQAGTLSDSIEVDITVNHVNRMPALVEVPNQTVDENKVLTFTVSGSDDDVEDNGKLVYSAENLPQGAVFKADSLAFSWTPTYEQSGTFQDIIIKVQDPSGQIAERKMTITVYHVNRPPVLASIEPKVVNENSPIQFSLQGSDPDKEDTGKLVYTVEGLPEGAALNGTEFSWTPTFLQSGIYNLKFTVSDGRLTDSKETSITVIHINRPPVLAEVPAQTVAENAPLTFNVEGSDPDSEDAGIWQLSASNMPAGASFDSTAGKFMWTPSFEQSGSFTITFKNSDPSGLNDEKTVTVTVNHVNRTPEIPDQLAQTIDENKPLEVKLVAAVDPDAEDENKIKHSVENLPEGAQFNEETLSISWTPTFDQSGEYTATVKATDGEFTVEKPLKITVNHINRPPGVTQPVDQTIEENKAWTLKVEFNDPDTEDVSKLILSATNTPQGMTFDPATATFTWTPSFEQSGVYSAITVKASDPAGLSDEKTFNVTVNHVNRQPALQPVQPISATENAPVNFTLQGSDEDQEDQGKLTYTAEDLPQGATLDAQSGSFNWTPTFLQAGNFTITFKVTDSGSLHAEQQMTITVADLNRTPALTALQPVTVKENEAVSVKVIGSDEDSDNELTYSAENLPTGANFDPATQTLSWTPGYEQAGSFTITFKLSDGVEEVTTPLEVTVENVNRAPKFDGLSNVSVKEDENVSFSAAATDEDEGAQLTYSADGIPDGASFNDQNGDFSWTPSFEQAGVYTVTFMVSDGVETVSQAVTITVENNNRVPTIDGPGSEEIEAGQSVSLSYSADDADGESITFSADNLPSGATMSTGGDLSWTTGENQAGSYTITVRASDGTDEASMETTITVNAKPQPEPQPEDPATETPPDQSGN